MQHERVVHQRLARTAVIALAAVIVVVTPLIAYAGQDTYVNQVPTSANKLKASTVRAAGLTGGGATVYVASTSTTHIQTRSGTTYAVLYSASASGGSWANLSHSNVANTWSTGENVSFTIELSCWRYTP